MNPAIQSNTKYGNSLIQLNLEASLSITLSIIFCINLSLSKCGFLYPFMYICLLVSITTANIKEIFPQRYLTSMSLGSLPIFSMTRCFMYSSRAASLLTSCLSFSSRAVNPFFAGFLSLIVQFLFFACMIWMLGFSSSFLMSLVVVFKCFCSNSLLLSLALTTCSASCCCTKAYRYPTLESPPFVSTIILALTYPSVLALTSILLSCVLKSISLSVPRECSSLSGLWKNALVVSAPLFETDFEATDGNFRSLCGLKGILILFMILVN
eukprot:TRINITY_DN4495_c0_g4_i1.p1 TRINITY_DN4495_c0_g4~~TRINITY_DN4495_c0_g4_i1.p1  ORF type:complete len:267 (+),score=-29.62 TRINITY_DN4495_c0_g4_i1:93-893(+)